MNGLLSKRLQTLIENPAGVGDFWTEIEREGTPLIERADDENCDVTFLWRDDGTTCGVDVIQDWGADGIREHSMTRLDGTDIWYKTRVMPSNTRTTYQLAPEPLPAGLAGGVPFIPDPLNPKQFLVYFDESGFKIWFSSLVLPDAPAQPWINSNAPSGTVTLHSPFGDERRIWVYVPKSDAPSPYSLLVVFDGRQAKDSLGLPQMLDFQLAEGKIRPTVAVFIDNPDRNELMCKSDYAEYIAQKVIPWARATFPVTDDSVRTVINGSSYGGLCAAYIGLKYPNIFGNILSQTGWFRWHPDDDPEHEWLAREFIGRSIEPQRFYLDVGILENARMQDGGLSQLVANRHMRDMLQAKGYEVMYREYSGGHDYSSTQNPLFDALPLLLGL